MSYQLFLSQNIQKVKALGCGQRCSYFYMVGIFHEDMPGTCSPLIFLLCFSKTGLCCMSLAFCTHYVALANLELMACSYLNFPNAEIRVICYYALPLSLSHSSLPPMLTSPTVWHTSFHLPIRKSHVWKITNSEFCGERISLFCL